MTTMKLRVNPKAQNVMVGHHLRQGGFVAEVPIEEVTRMNSATLVGNYKGTGKPLLEIIDSDFIQRGWHPPAPRPDGKTWDVAYPLKHDIGNYDELRFSMRSLGNLAGSGRVYVAGGEPKWLNRNTVTHIPVPQTSKFVHIGQCLRAILESDISDDFIWMNDDMLFLNPVVDVPRFARNKPMADYAKSLAYSVDKSHNEFVNGMKSQINIVKAWGYDITQEFPGDTHHPMPMNKDRLSDILDAMRVTNAQHPVGHFKMLYNVGLDLTPIKDPKRKGHRIHNTTDDYFSFSEVTWAEQEWEARLSFRTKSPYEK